MPTADEARAELARRELARREASRREQGIRYGNLVLPTGAAPTAPVRPATAVERRARPAPPRPAETAAQRTQRLADQYVRDRPGTGPGSAEVQLSTIDGAIRALGGLADTAWMGIRPAEAFTGGRMPSRVLDDIGARYNPTSDEGKLAQGAAMMAGNAIVGGGPASVILPTLAGEAARIGTREAGYDEPSQENMRGLAQVAAGLTSGVRLGRPGPPRVKPERLSRQEEAALRRVTRGVKPAEARARIAAIQEYGGEPVIADAIGSRGRVRIRAAATRDIPEQQTAVDFQTARRVNAQDFAENLGARISPETRSPQAAQEAIASARSNQAAIDYGAVAGEQVPVTPEVISALADDYGRAAVARARTDAIANREYTFAEELASLDSANPPANVSARALDAIRRAMGGRGARLNQNPNTANTARGVFGRAESIDSALDDVDALKPARANFRESIGQEEAVVAGGRLFAPGTRADVEAAARMSAEQRQAALAGARNAIEEAAGKPAGAASVLDELATGRRVSRRLNAYGGPEVAADVQRGARVGREMLETARNVSPRIGSETNLNVEGSGALNGVGAVAEAGLAVKTGGLSAMFRPVVEMLKRARMSDADAGRMIQIALDPDPRKLELALQYLEGTSPTLARMVRAELGRIAARGAPVAAIAGSTAASQAQARPSPPR